MTKTGPQFVIEHMALYSMIADRKFWVDCPEFSELHEEAKVYHQRIVEEVLGAKPGCGTCGTMNSVLRPFFGKFTQHILSIWNSDADKLDNLISYISRKRGYRPVPITVYCTDADKRTRQLRF